MNTIRLAAHVVLAMLICGQAIAQNTGPSVDVCSPSSLKKLALTARSIHPDTGDFIRALDFVVGADTEYFDNHSAIALSDSSLGATVMFPYAAHRLALIEALRKRDPIDDISVVPGVVVSIAPTRVDAPDIVKVIVERNGKEVPPIANLLKATPMETRAGVKAVIHAGSVFYPCAAFAPGARVHVVLIPERGTNIERDMRPHELTPFSTKQADVVASALIGKTAAAIELRIGKPTQIDGRRWTYKTAGETFFVYSNDSDVVVDAQPKTFDITVLER